MLISTNPLIDSSKFTQEDQLLILTGASWEDYEKLDSPEYNHYLISYLNNQITIMSPGRNHERIAQMIADIILSYCKRFDIIYFPFGSTRLKEENKEGKEPDTAYAFGVDKDSPDLAVEVNFTSGSIDDLTKYKYLKVKEVWIWQNRELKFYHLQSDRYIEVKESIFLKGIKSAILIHYINRGFTESPLVIEREFFDQEFN